jgi:hypothetical protein
MRAIVGHFKQLTDKWKAVNALQETSIDVRCNTCFYSSKIINNNFYQFYK